MVASSGPRASKPGVIVASTSGGAVLGAVAILGTALLTIWLTGYVRVFADDRGFLQLVLAIPVAEATAGFVLAYFRVLSPKQLLWAMAPMEALIVLGAGLLDVGFQAWPWVLAVSGCVLVPWMLGLIAGQVARGRT